MRKLAHHHEYSINIERARKVNFIRKQKIQNSTNSTQQLKLMPQTN
jgi:hypothetical protein